MGVKRRLARLEANSRETPGNDPEVVARVARYTEVFRQAQERARLAALNGEVYQEPTLEEQEAERQEFLARYRQLLKDHGRDYEHTGGRG